MTALQIVIHGEVIGDNWVSIPGASWARSCITASRGSAPRNTGTARSYAPRRPGNCEKLEAFALNSA